MKTYEVRAVRWKGGWELHIEGEGVTQSRTLGSAVQRMQDYLETVYDDRPLADDAHFNVTVDGINQEEVEAVKAETRSAAEAQIAAAAHSRSLARRLRQDEHLSVTDVASLLGVSRGRVSQLLADNHDDNHEVILTEDDPASYLVEA